MPARDLVFLDWSEPAADATARLLIAAAPPGHSADLSGFVAIVPTQQSGRRLREALARLAAESGRGGVVSPVVRTPGQFLDPADGATAAPIEAALFLAGALDSLSGSGDSDVLSGLFPAGYPLRSVAQRLAFARSILGLRAGLAEAELDIERAARILGPECQEAVRWAALSALESRYRQDLRAAGRVDPDDARIARAHSFPRSPEITRIFLLGVADVSPLLTTALDRVAADCTIMVAVFAPAEFAPDFDDWGRPRAEAWKDRPMPWEEFTSQIQLLARPADAAVSLRKLCPSRPTGGLLTVGALDRDLLPTMKNAIEDAGGRLHDPDGDPMSRHWLHSLITTWAGFVEDPSFRTTGALLRNAAIIAWMRKRVPNFRLEVTLRQSDEIAADHLPDTIFDARPWCESESHHCLRETLDALVEARSAHLGGHWLDALRGFLGEIVDTFQDDLGPSERSALDAVAAETRVGLDLLGRYETSFPDLDVSDWLRVLATVAGAGRIYHESGADDVEAVGWLELPWSDAPHLVLAGMNQGFVPETILTDPFLPDSMRERIGLACNRSRFARDAYFLNRILALRAGGAGRVDVLVGQSAASGDPLRPSSLLFLCEESELPARVQQLFGEPAAPEPEPRWEPGWWFTPPAEPMKRSIRVTAFADYLACPFRFYLRFGLRMEPWVPASSEMDARVFGTLMHGVLESFAREESKRSCGSAAEIRRYVLAGLDEAVSLRFGSSLSLSLLVQIEAARRRLAAFANEQARQYAEGWRIRHVETSFEELLGEPFAIDGWTIGGKIDRIDHHPSGRWRVLDYKTSDKAATPAEKHLGSVRSTDWLPEYAQCAVAGLRGSKERRWTSLQLPLYRHVLAATGIPPESISCAYLNLPKAVADTRVLEWEAYGPDIAESADACARGVLADIARGKFWPPNSRPEFDAFADFFPVAPTEIVSGAALSCS